jgi:hypothetical protein
MLILFFCISLVLNLILFIYIRILNHIIKKYRRVSKENEQLKELNKTLNEKVKELEDQSNNLIYREHFTEFIMIVIYRESNLEIISIKNYNKEKDTLSCELLYGMSEFIFNKIKNLLEIHDKQRIRKENIKLIRYNERYKN